MRLIQPFRDLNDVFGKLSRSFHPTMKGYKPPKVPVLDCLQQTDLPRKRSGIGGEPGVCSHKTAVLNPFLDALVINADDQNPIIS